MTTLEWINLGKDLLTIGCTSLGTVWLSKYLDKRYKEKNINIDLDFKRKKEKLPILESIKYTLDADRVYDMVFTNGDVTLAGHHLKKISILLETTNDGFKEMAHDFQLVPSKIFERALDILFESKEGYYIFDESVNTDVLAALHKNYGIKILLKVKIKDQFGKWIGVLSVAFSKDRVLTNGEIAFVKMQAAKLGQLK